MGGCRENPMPSPENYIVIKLGETEVCAQQSIISCQDSKKKVFPLQSQIHDYSNLFLILIGTC